MSKFITKPTGGKQRKIRTENGRLGVTPLPSFSQPPRVLPQRPTINIRAAPILERLPKLAPVDSQRIWLNALRILSIEETDASARQEANLVLKTIEQAWKIRSLNQLPEDWFRWPETDAHLGNGFIRGDEWLTLGPLKFLGYTVGRDGETQPIRWAILRRAFEGVLPPVFPANYLGDWGDPGTPKRLRKIAESIASFTRLKKQQNPDKFSQAIHDWESDLRHLYEIHYIGRFHFAWPSA